jgi:hypothetical protein
MATDILKLSDESTGECTCGCGKDAFPFTFEGADGYVDAAPECAEEALCVAFPEFDAPVHAIAV